MNFERRYWFIGAALLLTSACQVETADEDGGDDASADEFRLALPPDVVSQVCPAYRQIAYVKSGWNCDNDIEGWDGDQLFEDDAPGEFARYCIYEHSEDNPSTAALTGHDKVLEIGSDCVSSSPATTLQPSLYGPLDELTRDRFGALELAELDGTENTRAPVLVSVVDVTPPGDPTTANSMHGMVVADLITSLAHGCDSEDIGTCPIEVRNVLGLPRTGMGRDDIDPDDGGYAGSQREAARGLYAAIRYWEGISSTPKPKHIINLSFAWLRQFGGGNMNLAPPGVDAFYLALERASCLGNLVMVSAGNANDDGNNDSMLPADFERRVEPTNARCTTLGVSRPNPPPPLVLAPVTYKPLVYAVGAVNFDDKASLVSRVGGRPRLAALGESVVSAVDPAQPPWSGTSLSVAGASAAAALSWSYNPSMSAREIGETLYASARPISGTANFGYNGNLHAIRRVKVCNALKNACAATGGCAGLSLACTVDPLPMDDLFAVIKGITLPAADRYTFDVEKVDTCEWYGGVLIDSYAPVGEDYECIELEGDVPSSYLTWPQPPVPGCSFCTWVTTNPGSSSQSTSVFVTIAPDFAGRTVLNAMARLTYDVGGSVYTGDFGLTEVNGQVPYSTTSAKELQATTGSRGTVRSGTIFLTFDGPPTVTTTDDPLVQGTTR